MSTVTDASNEPASPNPHDEYARLWAAKTVADLLFKEAEEKRKAEADKAAAARKKAEEDKKWEASRAFTSAYQAWLAAKAAVKIHETDDDDMDARVEAEDQAERRLFTTPAVLGEELWDKLTAFEWLLGQELTIGLRRNSILMLALGSIKQDILNLDLLGGAL
jgi:hypothetical protein